MKRTILSLVASLFCTIAYATEYTFVHQPPAGTWAAAGVPGGIPDTSGWTVTDLTGTVLTNGTDQGGTINTAITAASANTVLLLPTGTVTIGTRVTINKDSIVLRGRYDSATNTWGTILNFTAADVLVGAGYSFGTQTSVNGSVAAGQTNIPLSGSTAGFTVGRIVRIWQNNSTDPDVPIIDVSAQQKLQSQFTVITAKDASSITISPALIFPLDTSLSPEVWQLSGTRKNVGIEGLKFDATNKASGGTLQFWCTQGCWMKDNWVYNTNGYAVWLQSGNVQWEANHNTIDINRVADTGGPNQSGIKIDSASSCRIVDNIILDCFPGVEINGFPGQGGSSGNVIAYNYVRGTPTGGPDSVGYAFDTNHGAATGWDLYEGNIGPKFIHDSYYGSCLDVTAFRNWFQGKDVDPARTYDMICVAIGRFGRNFSIVGNLLGTTGTTFTYDAGDGGGADATHYIYKIGYPASDGYSYTGTAQLSVGDPWINYQMTGTLTTRTSDTAGVVTFTNGHTITGQLARLVHSGGTTTFSSGGTYSAPTLTLTGGTGAVLPVEGSSLTITTNTGGWQEIDLDVRASMVRLGNYNTQDEAIPAGESLGGDTLPDSLYLSSKPTWFGFLTWPAFDSGTPNMDVAAIPAGFRYLYGRDPTDNPAPSFQNPATGLGTGF